jgi:alpha-L-fucosidase
MKTPARRHRCWSFAALAAISSAASPAEPVAEAKPIVAATEIAAGPFQPTDASLTAYQCPDWFRDAKFGVWSHWGPQAVPREGDWYARGMYEETAIDRKTGAAKGQNRQNKYHLEHYGHPSKFGYKDLIPLWKAERLDPDQLMALYKQTGARYFVSMGTHHDNFFLWDSKIHRWNAVKMGPMKDIVGLYQQAAKKQGLKFGVSEHLGASFTWFRTAHGADQAGPMKDVPYDGNDPQFQDL